MNYFNSYGSSDCGCNNSNQGIYGTNMWNVNGNQPGNQYSCSQQQACNGCIDVIKGICVLYTGTNLINTGINQNDDLNTIMGKIDAFKAILDTRSTTQDSTQAITNRTILSILNDINNRLVALEGVAHIPYTLDSTV